jgi:hypothetical protein
LVAQILFVFQLKCLEISHCIAPSLEGAMSGQTPQRTNKRSVADYAK